MALFKKKIDAIFQDELVKFVKTQLEERREERKAFELQWLLNMNFLNGNQFCDIDMQTQSITDVEKLYWYQNQEVFNQIAPIIETRMAKLGKVDPVLKVRPASSSRIDISTAKTCSSILKGTYTQEEMSRKIKYANYWCEITGTVFHKSIWNPEKGRSMGMLSDNTEVKEGNVEHVIVNCLECFPDSTFSEDVPQCRSFIHSRVVHVDEIYDLHGIEVKGEELEVWNISQTSVNSGGLGYTANTQKITSTKRKNQTLLNEYYEIPSRRYPNGRLIIIAGDKLVYQGDLPYMVGEDKTRAIPFVRQVCIERPGHFWGVSIIERLLPVQRAYNAVKNRKHEFLNRCVLQVLTYEEGAVDSEMIESEGIAPGSHLPYTPGHPAPSFMQNGSLPQEFNFEEQKLEELFTQISGVSTFSRDSLPPTGANSGIAIQIVQEQDNTRISLTAENIRLAVVSSGKMWLKLYKQFANGPRVLRFIDEANEVMVMDWESSKITSFDVVIESENELSQSPAQRRQMVFDLLTAGLFVDPETGKITRTTRDKILEMLELGNWESSVSLDEDHVHRAQRENMLTASGQIVNIFEYDDDLIHMNEHLKYMLSQEFELVAEKNPDLGQNMLAHMREHDQAFLAKNAPPPQQLPPQQQPQPAVA